MGFKCEHNTISLRNLSWAIGINLVLSIVQILAGLLSGSLSLIADAIHNLSDAISLLIAFVAEKISHWPANQDLNFGYGRAQIIGALINSLSLILVAIYIIYEVILRFLEPKPINGWWVIIVASFALVIDLLTAKLTHEGSKHNINMRAAFIHNVTDALASIVVIFSGVLVLLYDFYIFDLLASLLIAGYICYQSIGLIQDCLRHLMQAVPADINYQDVQKTILNCTEIKEIKNLYIWSMNESQIALQAHLILQDHKTINQSELLVRLKKSMLENYKIQMTTFELSP